MCVVDGVCTVAWCVQVKRMIGGTGNMLFSILFQNLRMGKIQGLLSVNL